MSSSVRDDRQHTPLAIPPPALNFADTRPTNACCSGNVSLFCLWIRAAHFSHHCHLGSSSNLAPATRAQVPQPEFIEQLNGILPPTPLSVHAGFPHRSRAP